MYLYWEEIMARRGGVKHIICFCVIPWKTDDDHVVTDSNFLY